MKKFSVLVMIGALLYTAGFTAQSKPLKGYASYYKHGKITANGEKFYPMGLTAAHRSLPFGTRLKVTNLKTRKTVVVRINDRGPFINGRMIDLSLGAATAVGMRRAGVVKVEAVILN